MSSGRHRVLFVTYGGGHVNMVIPLIKALQAREDYEVHVLGLTTAYQVLKAEGIEALGYVDLICSSDQRAIEVGAKLTQETSSHPLVSQAESRAYLGLNYQVLEERYGENKAAERYQQLGRKSFYPLSILKRLLLKIEPQLVVATNSPRSEKAAIDAATELGIPSICLVDMFATQDIRWIGQPGYASRICVLSESVKQKFIEAGRHHDEVVVTGNPAFDRLKEKSAEFDRQQYRLDRGWSQDDKVILWASGIEPSTHPATDEQGDPELPRKIEKILETMVGQEPNLRAVFRSHPNDTYLPIPSSKRVELSFSDEDLFELISACDCVIVMASTVGLQAALLRVPLISIRLSILSFIMPYDELGWALGVRQLEDLPGAIRRSLMGQVNYRGLPEYGHARDKVFEVIAELLEIPPQVIRESCDA
ncbi:UDP-N-acetylglucosamine 2-epimerase [Dongshaea marina]|uniref:UDP-N-acetylglucosamine 2-epimerase n=1 Tax=Dongshaea marina TaxID=2047966 RepID=UPI00131EE63B|nr:UDP-N-acetylglucosamine 2-epimerase [Dongshaea marina]